MINFETIKSYLINNPIVAIATLGIVGVGAYSFIKKYNDKKLKKKLQSQVFAEEQNALMASNQRTISDEKALSIATALYNAMKGFGTDEDDIYNIMIERNNLTSADIIAVNSAFGMREYGSYGAPSFGSGTYMNLVGWFNEELSNTSNLFKLLKTKFEQAGILWN